MLVVTDDGPGIPADDRARVFERFTRLHDARDRDTGGSGLGLAIVGELVRQQGGTVTADRRRCRRSPTRPAGGGSTTSGEGAKRPPGGPVTPDPLAGASGGGRLSAGALAEEEHHFGAAHGFPGRISHPTGDQRR